MTLFSEAGVRRSVTCFFSSPPPAAVRKGPRSELSCKDQGKYVERGGGG